MPAFLIEMQAIKFTRKTNEEGDVEGILHYLKRNKCLIVDTCFSLFFSAREIYVQSTKWYEIKGIYTLH